MKPFSAELNATDKEVLIEYLLTLARQLKDDWRLRLASRVIMRGNGKRQFWSLKPGAKTMPRTDRLSNYRTTWHGNVAEGGVTYVSTEIVKWDDKSVTLNSGGWRTVTTKRKMNQAARQFILGYRVEQKKGEWSVYLYGTNVTLPFADGMTFAKPV
jgi:hypothetical protein